MDLTRRQRIAILGAMAAIGVAVVVVIVSMATGGGDDAVDPPRIETVEQLADALGCDEVQPFDGALPLPKTEDALCTRGGRDRAAGLHVATDAGARAAVVQYFAQPPPGGEERGCADDSPEVAADRVRYAVVAGDRWVVTTRDPEVIDAALAAGGQEIPEGPQAVPPASYVIGTTPCGEEPLLSSG